MQRILARVGARRRRILYLAVLIFLLPQLGRADTITVFSSRDTTIYRDSPTNSAGAGEAMIVGTTARSSPHRALIGFDVADSLPAGATITSVQLTLVLNLAAPGETRARPIELHRLLADWGEGATGRGMGPTRVGRGFPAPTDGTTATWSHRFYNTLPWTNPGGDFVTAASGSTMVGTAPQGYVWDSTPAMVNDVQSWLEDPTHNFGWLLLLDDPATSTARRFDTREAANRAVWPSLTINFSAAPVPEPSTVTLLAFGLLGLVGSIRRWRQRVTSEQPARVRGWTR